MEKFHDTAIGIALQCGDKGKGQLTNYPTRKFLGEQTSGLASSAASTCMGSAAPTPQHP